MSRREIILDKQLLSIEVIKTLGMNFILHCCSLPELKMI